MTSDILDFTEHEYASLLELARRQWPFISYREALEGARGCLWRHDVDFSMHRAAKLAAIETEQGVRATYFILLHSPFYNALEPEVATRIRAIRDGGHSLGIHIEPAAYVDHPIWTGDLSRALSFEKAILEDYFETTIEAFSFHNPTVVPEVFTQADAVGGMINAYGETISGRFPYVSDSNGYWRHRRLRDVIESREHDSLHVLTHPEWWTPEAMTPRNRVTRCIEGRAQRLHHTYDAFLKEHGRVNVR